MRQLLDTHTFLWFVSGNDQLSEGAKSLILDPLAVNYVSLASIWEISIKVKLGKLQIRGTVESIVEDISDNNFEILPINISHITKNFEYEFHHRDPFDRMIIAQAEVEHMNVIGRDVMFDKYLTGAVKRIW